MQEPRQFDYDDLKMYFGDPYQITDKITIYQPTIGDIINFGEKEFYSIVYIFCANTTMYRLPLWKSGIDWNNFSNFELFINLTKGLKVEQTKLLFGDLDFSQFYPVLYNEGEDEEKIKIIYALDEEIQIDELIYNRIADYVRRMFDFYPKVERAKGKATKEALIEEDEQNLKIQQAKGGDKENSVLFPLISAMINHPGFKYKKNELRDVGIVEFMDSVKRLQTYENVRALMSGMYSGMLDTSKMNLDKELNWARDLYVNDK